MLNVDTIKNGLVIDHIKAGTGPKIFKWLGLDKAPFCVALILNVHSDRQGKKDIIKIDNIINIDYSVLGFIDHNITVNVVQDEKIVKKITLELPSRVENVIRCKNPRCITTTEKNIVHTFKLFSGKNGSEYRCEYCDTAYDRGLEDIF
ncbi:MAG: aspartate carbamoyltransferase regulatory subunit [Spirochaetes bacterium]|uniref:Aspartate carbamoyltransferase regulatory subunit n=1 Tax=Candidatus Gallitreponema excrementavium TaxID=2840840 RepID=A0A9D9N2X0_9SPIR|nr:aspartate carbamoyltransferase regulatory subunit [Candidatus Gallitreponema excrementavium]